MTVLFIIMMKYVVNRIRSYQCYALSVIFVYLLTCTSIYLIQEGCSVSVNIVFLPFIALSSND